MLRESDAAEPAIVGFRLSPQQSRLWQSYRANPSAYNVRCTLLVEGRTSPMALREAVRRAVDRHESLRTTFQSLPGMELPLQVIGDNAQFGWEVVDLSGLAPADAQVELDAWASAARHQLFDAAAGPLLKVACATVSPEQHALLIACSSLCADGASLNVLAADIARLLASVPGAATAVAEPVQYADYAEWENQRLQSQAGPARAYTDASPPSSSGSPSDACSAPECVSRSIPPDVKQRLECAASARGASLEAMLLGCWHVLLSRLGKSEAISVLDDGRDDELAQAVGLFERYEPVSIELDEDQSFHHFATQVARKVQDARQRWRTATGEGATASAPRFFFDYRHRAGAIAAEGLTVSLRDVYACSCRSRLRLCCIDLSELQLHYDPALHDRDEIERVAERYVLLLQGVAENLDRRMSSFDVTLPHERQQLVSKFAAVPPAADATRTVVEMIEDQARQAGDKTAVVGGGRELTYRQLDEQASRWAQVLRANGVGPEVLVGLFIERSVDALIAIVAIWKAGGAYVPLDPSYPPARVEFILGDARPAIVLTLSRLTDALPPTEIPVLSLDLVPASAGPPASDERRSEARPDRLAYVMYTSGTTGEPKGVMITHANLRHYVHALQAALNLSADDRYLHTASFSFSSSVRQLLLPLCRGAALIVATPEQIAAPLTLFELIRRLQVTVIDIVPTYWRTCIRILRSLHSAAAADVLDNTLRLILSASEPLTGDVPAAWARLGHRASVINMYGQTETAGIVAVHRVQGGDGDAYGGVPVGRPIANTAIYVLNPRLQPVPPGESGELHVSGGGVGRGYLNRPELTAQKFVRDPFSSRSDARLYKTGDLGRHLADGTIELLGRQDSQIKIRGFRVEPTEVEAALRQHPAVQDAVVVAEHDAEGGGRLAVFVVRSPERRAPVGELLRYLRDKLPEYAVPSRVEMIDKIPLTATGKVDRRALQAGSGRKAVSPTTRAVTVPATSTQQKLLAIWGELLGTEDIRIDDNFFEVGGHSLLAALMLSRIRDTFQADLTWQRLFEAPTIADLASAIESTSFTDVAASDAPLLRLNRGEALQPSLGQQRLLFLEHLSPGSAAYNVSRAISIKGPLAIAALEQSLNEIVRRHEILRAAFPANAGEAQIVVAASVELRLTPVPVDRSDLPRAIAEEAGRPFAIAAGPLIRCRLFQSGAQDHTLVVVLHHIVTDGWSMEVFFRELGLLYGAFIDGRPSPLPDLPVQYTDFASWQRRHVEAAEHRAHLDYWTEQLRGSAATLDLPTDRPRPAIQSYRGATHSVVLPRALCERLESLCQQEGVTLFMALLAAFQTLLHRYTGQHDIVVGSPIAGRTRPETENLIGLFINMLVLRTDLSGQPKFRQILDRVRRIALSAYEHQEVPFEKLVEVLHPSRDLSRSPLFESLFAFQSVTRPPLDLPGLVVAEIPAHSDTAKFDLSLYVVNDSSSERRTLTATLEYNTDLFDAATARRMLGHLETLLQSVAANPDQPIADLPLLTEAEKHQLLVEWNETRTDFPAAASVHQLIEAQAARSPSAIAVVADGHQLTYAQLNVRANQLARRLRALGVDRDVLVGICVDRSPDMVVGLLAILKAGGAYVPLDPAYPKERLEFIVGDSRISVLLTQASLQGLLNTLSPVLCIDSDWDDIAREDAGDFASEGSPDRLAYVIYTSGSTGLPKGVQIPHRAVVNFLGAMQRQHGLAEKESLLAVTTLSFDIAGLELYLPLVCGGTVVLASRDVAMDGARLIEALDHSGASIMQATPTTWQMLIEAGWRGSKTLKVLCGGEPLPRQLANQLLERCSSLWNMYGPTETTIWSTAHLVSASDATVSIGRPIDNTDIYILDAARQPVPIGVSGELHIGGSGLARGYFNRSELTAQKFIPDPFASEPGARLYKTGDLARYQADGNIELLGRLDHQVKIRGFRIELGEIETVLTQCPGLMQAVVVARDDGSGRKTLAAYVTTHRGSDVSVAEMIRHVKSKLPDYMVPSAFVRLDELPLTPNGKIDRAALPSPGLTRLSSEERGLVPPRDHLERQVANIWERILGVHVVGVTDNFFDLGGYSLLAVRVMSQIEAVLGAKLPVTALFQMPTVEQLARLLREEVSLVPWASLVPLQPKGSKAPFFWVHGEASDAVLARHFGADQPLYGVLHQAHDGRPARYTTVEDIAAHYLSEIRTVQAHGPYFIGGFCFGAVVAFEIAQQLKRDNEQVAVLALVDPSNLRNTAPAAGVLSSHVEPNGDDQEAAPLLRFARKLRDAIVSTRGAVRKRSQVLAGRVYLQRGLVLPDRLRSQYILNIYFRALDRYKPTVYAGPVIMFRANPTWTGVLAGRVAIHEVRGSHADILEPAQVSVWAEILKPVLAAAQTAADPASGGDNGPLNSDGPGMPRALDRAPVSRYSDYGTR